MRRRGRVQDRDRLLNEVWGYESVIDTARSILMSGDYAKNWANRET